MRKFIVEIGGLIPFKTTAKNPRAVVNRYVAEPDTVAIIREPASDTGRLLLWRSDRTGLTERIGWIMEVNE